MDVYLIPPDWRAKEDERQAVEAPERIKGIGGSEAATILGISKWGTPASLWASKLGLTENTWDPDPHSLPYWGLVMEPVLLREFAIDIGKEVVGRWWDQAVVRYLPDGSVLKLEDDRFAHLLGTVQSPEPGFEFMIGHIDGLILEDIPNSGQTPQSFRNERWCYQKIVGIVDGKTANLFMAREWGDEMTDQVPGDYLCQVNHYQEIFLHILGYAIDAWVALLLGGMTWRLYKVPYHAELAMIIKDAEAEFWASVQAKEMPPIPPTQKGLDLLRQLHPAEASTKVLDITGQLEWVAIGDKLNATKMQEAALKKKRIGLEVEFQDLMATHGEVTCASRPWSVTWKRTKAKKQLKVEDLLGSISRRFEISEADLDEERANHTIIKQGSRRFVFSAKPMDEPEEEGG